MSEEKYEALNFIEEIIEGDIKSGKHQGTVHTRFPPEPNGYLHIGHAKAICINFEMAKKYGGKVNLRFDDTNPTNEKTEYVDAIKRDISWLGYEWDNEAYYTSDYFDTLYGYAIKLIQDGNAYIDDSTVEEISEQKGVPTKPGTNSPFRERSVEENLELFTKMKAGEFEDGARVLRAKVDMSSSNMHMRDPVIYRIKHATHHRTGDDWCIYPMYDFAHGQSDSIEKITHSLCSLEFIHHRPLYDWVVRETEMPLVPRQIEFGRLSIENTVMSKRYLRRLVEEGKVTGWDDPRMPTISGLRRRGYTPASIKSFIETVGVSKRENIIDVALLEFKIREDLNKTAKRVMGVLDPVKVVITNYPEDKEEILDASYNDYEEGFGSREVPFSREVYIEKEDFREEANKKFFRLKLGKEVRLKNAYIIKAESCTKDADGHITEIQCTYDPLSKSGSGTEESIRKVKGTLHWVSVKHAINAEVRSYDRLFSDEAPDSHKEKDFMEFLNPTSLEVINAFVEPSLQSASIGEQFQFQRLGYFNVDNDTTSGALVFNKTVGLRDNWASKQNK